MSQSETYLKNTSVSAQALSELHAQWLSRQLLSDVLQYQLQQEALETALKRLDHAPSLSFTTQRVEFVQRGSAHLPKASATVDFCISDMDLKLEPFTVMDRVTTYCVRATFGDRSLRTEDAEVNEDVVRWSGVDMTLVVPYVRASFDRVSLELYRKNEVMADSKVGVCHLMFKEGLGEFAGKVRDVRTNVTDSRGRRVGILTVRFKADSRQVSPPPAVDPEDLIRAGKPSYGVVGEGRSSGGRGLPLETVVTAAPPPRPPPLQAQQEVFANLVSDLRGDGVDNVKILIGAVEYEHIRKLGYEPAHWRTTKVMIHLFTKTLIVCSYFLYQKLPDFKKARNYLSNKAEIYTEQLRQMQEDFEQFEDVGAVLDKGITQSNNTMDMCNWVSSDLTDRLQALTKKLKQIKDRMDKLRPSLPKPKEPAYKPLEDIKYVPAFDRPPAVDEVTGRKKGLMQAYEMKLILDAVANGEMDGGSWDFGDTTLSSSQYSQLRKAVDARNATLDHERVEEKALREKTLEEFAAQVADWETDERRRKAAFELTKKDSRKHNLMMSCIQERMDFISTQNIVIRKDVESWTNMKAKHLEAQDRYRSLRVKQELERGRLAEAIQVYKDKLLALLVARRRALAYPRAAKTEYELRIKQEHSERSLRVLRYEVLDCKSKLHLEGTRLRQLLTEEETTIRSELNRLKILRESMRQKQAIDDILEKHNVEVLYLMEDLEKVKVVEAEHDDRGLAYTVDDLGEEYSPDKIWENPVIASTQKTIDLMCAKIALTDKLRETAVNCQIYIQEAVSCKWSPEFLLVRDSWCENSDYVRARQLLSDMTLWAHAQHRKLEYKELEIENKNLEHQLQVETIHHIAAKTQTCHEVETAAISESATKAIAVVYNKLTALDESSKERFAMLETTITELSREVHELREEKTKQMLTYDSKQKTLFAFIQTLQSTLEHVYLQLNILKEKIADLSLESAIESERLRYQLRSERRHSAALMFIIHMQRAAVKLLQMNIQQLRNEMRITAIKSKEERRLLRRDIWEHVFAFSKLSVDVDGLFEFFSSRLANIAGSGPGANDLLRRNGAALTLSALCRCPRPVVRKHAARALAGMGWNSFVEPRVIMWDCLLFWLAYKEGALREDHGLYEKSKEKYMDTGRFETILEVENELEPYLPPEGMTKRSVVRQKRQWALRATRQREGPNVENQKLINVKDGVISSLLDLCDRDGAVDWEIVRNAALAISVASYEEQNRLDMASDAHCIELLVQICGRDDPEIRTNAAVAIANLVHHNEDAQLSFGKVGAVPALLSMCRLDIPDVLESATSALSNLTSFCDENCLRVLEEGGVGVITKLLTVTCSENLLDFDQNDEIQANAAEILTNASRYNCNYTVSQFHPDVIDALIVACDSTNLQVKRHVPLVLGNIAENESCRASVGDRGGIEALFLVLEDSDHVAQANALWALSNLMWHTPNQTRAGLYLGEVIEFMASDYAPCKIHASILLANILYFNNSNRIRFLEREGALEMLVSYIRRREGDAIITESCLRSMLSISYMDAASLWLGGRSGNCIPLFLSFIRPPYFTREALKYSVEILLNLCVHHDNRRTILDSNGIDALVHILGDDEEVVRQTALQILSHLEDVTPPEVLVKMKTDIGLARMVQLASTTDTLVRAVAAESIGEEVWSDKKKQTEVVQLGGVKSLVDMCANSEEPLESLLPALWSLRNVVNNNRDAQNQLCDSNGISILVDLLRGCVAGKYERQTGKVMEGALLCVIAAIANCERNSRRLVKIGLDVILDIADGVLVTAMDQSLRDILVSAMKSDSINATAKAILQMLGPYNYVVCRNCQRKQDLSVTHCFSCGYKLLVDLGDVSSSSGANGTRATTAFSRLDPGRTRLAIDGRRHQASGV